MRYVDCTISTFDVLTMKIFSLDHVAFGLFGSMTLLYQKFDSYIIKCVVSFRIMSLLSMKLSNVYKLRQVASSFCLSLRTWFAWTALWFLLTSFICRSYHDRSACNHVSYSNLRRVTLLVIVIMNK